MKNEIVFFFPFLIYWTLWKMTKTCIMTSSAPIAWRCQVSSFLRVEWTAEHGRESYFPSIKAWSLHVSKKIYFHGPQYLDLNLYERQDLIFFIIHTFLKIYLYTLRPQTVNALWTKQSHCIPILLNVSNNRIMCMMSQVLHQVLCKYCNPFILITPFWFINFYYLYFSG